MEIVHKLPLCLARKMFMHFRHPVSQIFMNYWRPPAISNLLKDVRDYPASLRKLYSLSFAKEHDGAWGRARLLNSLWIEHLETYFGDQTSHRFLSSLDGDISNEIEMESQGERMIRNEFSMTVKGYMIPEFTDNVFVKQAELGRD